MASPFQQQSLLRKFVYLGLVVALFSVSLLHRKLIVNAQAEELRSRQSDQGEVDLTDSAFRLVLSGARGVAITSLWQAAIKKQMRHEWSELEILVRSLTKLQPHYVSPWLFQSWNLAFNVSVECDRSRDKYFYITRGIELLAEGERKNKGNEHPDSRLRSPAHPELRFFVGFYCQLKIGQGDEKRTLNSLFDLSSIEPSGRDPEALWKPGIGGKAVDLERFKRFCEANPRLVRRLREQLGFEKPEMIVAFLADNRDVPSRYAKQAAGEEQARLLPEAEQFPVVPPPKAPHWPDPKDVNWGGVELDLFYLTRVWYEYAQEPLPPPTGKRGEGNEPKAIPGQHRMPRMSQYIFRTYPARAQAYVAESLEEGGWFGGEGWVVTDWFDELERDREVVVGKGSRFHAGEAWRESHVLYKDFGVANGLLVAPQEQLGPAVRSWVDVYLSITNFTSFLEQTNAERDPAVVAARKKFYQAERLRLGNNVRALTVYQEAIQDWIDVLLQFPAFAKLSVIRDETYESQVTYMKLWREQRERQVEPLWLAFSGAGFWPPDSAGHLIKYARDQAPRDSQGAVVKRVVALYKVRGPFEIVYLYTGAGAEVRKAAAVGLAQAALWPPAPLGQLLDDRQDRRLLMALRERQEPPPPDWTPLLPEDSIVSNRQRLNLVPPSPEQAAPAPGGQAGADKGK